jgi:uncharacterized membrane protein YjgN (DUF898 family)
MEWYYKAGTTQVGPISKAELRTLLEAGRISGKTLVRNTQMREWRPLVELAHSGSPSGAPQVDAVSVETAAAVLPAASKTALPPLKPAAESVKLHPFVFKGSGGEYFKIWIVNILLSIVTLGIYSAWAKVRRKQYFYGNTYVAESAFRYLADPKKILKGRIVVFLGFIAYTIIEKYNPVAAIALMIPFVGLLPWLVVRSQIFNYRNSALRNIRFDFTGTYWQAAKVFVLLPILAPFTLGILFPYVMFKQKQFVVENSKFGTTPFSFHAVAGDYYRIFFSISLPLLIAAVLVGLTGYGIYSARISALPGMVSIGVVLAALYLYAIAFVSVRSSNLLYNKGALLRHRFKANMEIKSYSFILLTNTLATVLTLGLFHPFAAVRAYAYKISRLALVPGGDLDQFAAAESREISALGGEMADFMDFDFGI